LAIDEGWAIIILYFMLFLIVLGAIELTVIYLILKRTPNRIIHLGIPAIVFLVGYFLLMNSDAAFLVFSSLLFVGPVAALIPPFAIPNLTDPKSRFMRILVSYIGVSVFGILYTAHFGLSKIWLDWDIYWHTPFSNAKIYAGLIIMDTIVAFIIYGLMHIVRPAHRIVNEKNE
jgi:hypothetical protein